MKLSAEVAEKYEIVPNVGVSPKMHDSIEGDINLETMSLAQADRLMSRLVLWLRPKQQKKSEPQKALKGEVE